MISSAVKRPERSSFQVKYFRNGYTLIELLVVISLSAMLTGIIVAAMASLLRFDRHIKLHVENRTELQRFAASIRSDLHHATDFQWDAAEQTFELEHPKQQSIRYQVIAGRWMRLAVQENDLTTRTGYVLTKSFQCQCEPSEAPQGTRVRIRFTCIPDDEDDQDSEMRPSLQCEIIATVGRNHHLLSE